MIRLWIAMTMFAVSVVFAGVGAYSLWHRVGYRGWVAADRWIEVDLDGGNVELAYAYPTRQRFARRGFSQRIGPFGVLRIGTGMSMGRWRYFVLLAPQWAYVGAFFIPSSFYLARERTRRGRARRGECIDCGYNLTGLVEPRCPECACPLADRCTTCGRERCRHHRARPFLSTSTTGTGHPANRRL